MKMMPPDVISHENQLQHLSEPSIFILDVFRTADHAGQLFIPHRLLRPFYTTAIKGLMFFKFVRAASSISWSVFSFPYSFLRKTVIGGSPRLSIRSIRDDQILILVIRTDLMP